MHATRESVSLFIGMFIANYLQLSTKYRLILCDIRLCGTALFADASYNSGDLDFFSGTGHWTSSVSGESVGSLSYPQPTIESLGERRKLPQRSLRWSNFVRCYACTQVLSLTGPVWKVVI